MKNQFLQAVNKYDVYTENGAVSNSTSGSSLVDYFAKCGTYRDREDREIRADLSAIWAESPMVALQMMFYNRMITRKISGMATTTQVQKGQGNKSEFRKSMIWLSKNHPDVFRKNLWLIPVVGCWKDLWHEECLPHFSRPDVFDLIEQGMQEPYNRDLLSKFLPKIRSKRNTHTDRHRQLNDWARALCTRFGWTEKDYRRFKSSGKAHQFQQNMSAGLWDNIDFGRIPGKALFTLVNHRDKKDKLTTIERHGLEKKYLAWIEKQPVAKFTGYVYELYQAYRKTPASQTQKHTLNKQFEGLLELARKDKKGLNGNVWCALDTSGSMSCSIPGSNSLTALDVCISLGIYFSALNTGSFKDHVIMFDHVSRKLKLKGTFTDRIDQVNRSQVGWGDTNFQSVIDEIVRVRQQNPNIPVEEYPQTLLVVSDMQFNPTGNQKSNYDEAMSKLAAVGLPKMSIIWWHVIGRSKDVPSTIDDEGTTLIGGFDGAVVTLLLSGEQETTDAVTGQVRKLNPHEQMLRCLDQEILKQLKI